MSVSFESDPQFCALVDQFYARSSQDRRSSQREEFPVTQRVAPFDGSLPEDAEFRCVECHDLTTRGFSFLAESRPASDSLVLALDTPPDITYLAADVRHCTDVVVHPSGDVEPVADRDPSADDQPPDSQPPKRKVLVGCEFTRRVAVRPAKL